MSCSSSKVGSESKLLPQVDIQENPSKNRNNVFDREKKKEMVNLMPVSC